MNSSRKTTAICVAFVILAAILCRNIGRELPGRALSIVRSFLYVGLFMAWGISLRRRVMQPQSRRFLTGVAALMVVWIMERSVKYYFVSTAAATRYLWYFFYLPMLFIPLLAVFVAASLGKPEDYCLPKWTRLLYVPAAALLLLVLTNDLHQLVFRFDPALTEWRDSGYTYGAGYYAVAGFMGACALAALGIMIYKCRGSRGRRGIWLPLCFLPLSAAYAVLYAMYIEDHTSLLYYLAGDMTVTLCLLFAGLLESCLQTGLIPTNTGYDALFKASSVGMKITDEQYAVRYASDAARPLAEEAMRRTEQGEYLIDENTLLKAYAIHGGHIVWQEDVSELLRVKRELESAREELQERNDLLRDQYRKDAQRYKLEEQNRLYDLIQRETQHQLREIDTLAAALGKMPQDAPERQKMLLRILVLATYIKRHKDMLLSADRSETLPLHVIEGALRESCSNLPLGGVKGNLYLPPHKAVLKVDSALAAYELFEDALEAALDSLQYFFVTLSEENGVLCLHVDLEGGADLSDLREKYPAAVIERDDNAWFLSQELRAGGESA